MTEHINPQDALGRSVAYFEDGDRDAARYWLDVAAELRSGWRDKSQGYISHLPPAPAPEPDSMESVSTIRIPDYLESDATALINVTGSDHCPGCGAERFRTAEGRMLHRSTYEYECEFVTAAS